MAFLDDWGMLKISRENGSLSVLIVVGVWGAVSWHLCLGVGYVVDKIKAMSHKQKTEKKPPKKLD